MSQALVISRAQIREVLRENPELHMMVLEEGTLRDAWEWLKKKGQQARDSFVEGLENLKQEWGETEQGKNIVAKAVRGEKLSQGEKDFLSEQAQDVFLRFPVLAFFFALPGGSIMIGPAIKIAKKLGVEMMPSAFR